MPRRVLSVLFRGPESVATSDPVLEANAYAVAEDVVLSVLLRGAAIELALAGAGAERHSVAGANLPSALPAQDLRGLIESGVQVYADTAAMQDAGVAAADLVDGVEVIAADAVYELVRDADAVLTW